MTGSYTFLDANLPVSPGYMEIFQIQPQVEDTAIFCLHMVLLTHGSVTDIQHRELCTVVSLSTKHLHLEEHHQQRSSEKFLF